MNLADLSIKRPVFISCIFALILIVGGLAFKSIGVDLFPNITFPVVLVTTLYPGAGPEEIEIQVSKPIEDSVATLSGIKSVRSMSKETVSIVIAEFTQETDIKFATQQVRDRVATIRAKLPNDIEDPIIRNVDPADFPIAVVGVSAKLGEAELYDLTDETIKTRIEQVPEVGLVELYGARKREIHVELDRQSLRKYEVSASAVSSRIGASGRNIPAGKVINQKQETVIRSMAEFKSLKDIESIVVNFMGNDVPVLVKNVANVTDGLEDETSRTFIDGSPAIFLYIYKQSGANTVAVFDGITKAMAQLNKELKDAPGSPRVSVVRDGAKPIRINIEDVQESIFLGILLTILVVYLFLGNMRSTIITGVALPNSLIGAFILLMLADFTINVTSLLGLSLAVGLLIDDAIVVRENIFRHMELGEPPLEASSKGTKEVMLAVIATTLCIIAVFGPVSFISGIIGRFLREFGLTVCFAMTISLFDSLTMGPMLSAYFGGVPHHRKENFIYRFTIGALLRGFDNLQEWLAATYERVLRVGIHWPFSIIAISGAIFVYSLFLAKKIPMNFMSNPDMGEFLVDMDAPAGTTLDGMADLAKDVEATLRQHKEVTSIITTLGNTNGESNLADFYVKLVPRKERSMTTSDFKEIVRKDMAKFSYANPMVKDATGMAGGGGSNRGFNVNIIGPDLDQDREIATRLSDYLKKQPDLKDIDISYRPGKPELQVVLDTRKADQFGISSTIVGGELRTLIEGSTPAVFRQNGREYDIRVRLKESERRLKGEIDNTFIPNINQSLIRLSSVAKPVEAVGPATINRQDRGRYVQVSGDLAPRGGGLSKVIKDVQNYLENGPTKLPIGTRYKFVGQAESFGDMARGILIATLLGICFIYMVLASLYESYVTPFTIMIVFPLAVCGAFIALTLTHQNLDMMAMIGCVMLVGLATKNSILLVDYANRLVSEGKSREEAIITAGRVRLRPILMTSIALITGMLPIAVGLSEVSAQRAPMGTAVIGGVISSTLLTLLVVPAVYSYLDRFRVWTLAIMKRRFTVQHEHEDVSRQSSPVSHQADIDR